MEKQEVVVKEVQTPSMAKAIRVYCSQCGNETFAEVRGCPLVRCPLFPYRFGMNPKSAIKSLQKTYTIKVI